VSAGFAACQAVLVLLTGDDEAKLLDKYIKRDDDDSEKNLMPQPRPNVLFEAGLAFGTHPSRTILIQVGKMRPFSDMAGIHMIRLSNEATSRNEIAQRLKSAGCDVDQSGSDWFGAGDFHAISS